MGLGTDPGGYLLKGNVVPERGLARPALAGTRGLDGTLVDAAGELPEAHAPLAETRRELLLREPLYVTHGGDAHLRQHALRGLADAWDLADRKSDKECLDLMWPDDEAAVGLAPVAGDLGEELVRCHASRGGEVRLLADLAPDHLGCLCGGGDARQLMRDVEVDLVEREPVHQGRGPLYKVAPVLS